VEDENMSGRALVLAAVAAAATMLIAGSTLPAETAKEGTYSGKLRFVGKVTQQINIGENGRDFISASEEDGKSSSDPPVKFHCLSVDEDVNGVFEKQGFCVDTDNDGDQVLWKFTEDPHHSMMAVITRTEEEIVGTGKFEGRSATQTLRCAYAEPPGEVTYAWDCDVHGKYKLP
jgi:hypothetical protein